MFQFIKYKTMTTEEIRDAAKVMEAYANGKKIQFRKGINEWINTPYPLFNWDKFTYRVKPEPKYRPFESQEECWKRMLKHQSFGWIKDDYKYIHITSVFKDEIECTPDEDDDSNLHACIIKFTSVYNEQGYTFADGEPFGIKEE